MKKFLFSFLTIMLIFGSFTSCTENEIPDEVIAIYEQQAEAIAAKALLDKATANEKNAQAALILAETALKNAQVEAQKILNTYNEADNAVELALSESKLKEVLAKATMDAELAQLALEEANAVHEGMLAQIAVNLEVLNNEQIDVYFNFYKTYNDLNDAAKKALIVANLAVVQEVAKINTNKRSDRIAIASLNDQLTIFQGTKTKTEEDLALLTATIAPGTVLADMTAAISTYEKEIVDLQEQAVDLHILLVQKDITLTKLKVERDGYEIYGSGGGSQLQFLTSQYEDEECHYTRITHDISKTKDELFRVLETIAKMESILNMYDTMCLDLPELEALTATLFAEFNEATRIHNTACLVYQMESGKSNELSYILANSRKPLLNLAYDLSETIADLETVQPLVAPAVEALEKYQKRYDAAKKLFDEEGEGDKDKNLSDLEKSLIDLTDARERLNFVEAEIRELERQKLEYQTAYDAATEVFESANTNFKTQILKLESAEDDMNTTIDAANNLSTAYEQALLNSSTCAGIALGAGPEDETDIEWSNIVELREMLYTMKVQKIAGETVLKTAENVLAFTAKKLESLKAQINALLSNTKLTPEEIAAESLIIEMQIEVNSLRAQQELNGYLTHKAFKTIENIYLMYVVTEYTEFFECTEEIDFAEVMSHTEGMINEMEEELKVINDSIAEVETSITDYPAANQELRNAILQNKIAQLEGAVLAIEADITSYTALTVKYKAILDSLL